MIQIRLPEPEGLPSCGEELWCVLGDPFIRYESRIPDEPTMTFNDLLKIFHYHYRLDIDLPHLLRWQAVCAAEILKQYEEQTK